ncbi:MAG: hypothetical protein U0359_01585 [Byssovorax sp.]
MTSSPTPEPRGDRERRRARFRGAIALARARLRGQLSVRLGAALGALATGGLAVAALVLRGDGGGEASLEGLLGVAARVLTFTAAAPIALAAAADREAIDQRDGVLALGASRGLSAHALASSRVAAAMLEVGRALSIPLGALSLLVVALSGTARLALARIALAAGLLLFVLSAAVVLGGLGAAAGRAGRERGPWLLVALVVGPYLLADLAGLGAWSIPGALSALLDLVLRIGARA